LLRCHREGERSTGDVLAARFEDDLVILHALLKIRFTSCKKISRLTLVRT
jgi:hypothetical protein